MITIHDLLQDSRYKEFLCQVPHLPPHLTARGRQPWRLYVLLKGETQWRVKKFDSYPAMFRTFKRLLPKMQDAALHCGGYTAKPPMRIVRVKGKYFTGPDGKKQQVTKLIDWKPKMPADEFEDHYWCPYCRRPTVFKNFKRHHALPSKKTAGIPIDPFVRRCTICGASERIVTLRS